MTHADRRRRTRAGHERRQRQQADRNSFLMSRLLSDERVLALSGRHPLVTNRRILDARQIPVRPRGGEWVLEPLDFDRVTGWALGHIHDHRPVLRLRHEPVARVRHVPARRFLWYAWGNAYGPIEFTSTDLQFGRARNPVLIAIIAELERLGVPREAPFEVYRAGTREERVSRTTFAPTRQTPWKKLRRRLEVSLEALYAGSQLSWEVRLGSWLVLATLAWFVDPWLVGPAILLAEGLWIAFFHWTR